MKNLVAVAPKGVGVYLRRNPKLVADRYQASKIRWVALMAESLDFTVDSNSVKEDAEYFYAHKLSVWVWSFPNHQVRSAKEAADHLLECKRKAKAKGVIGDLELAGKKAPSKEWVKEFISRVIDGLEEGEGFIITSYPLKKNFPTMPWEEMQRPGIVGSPQVYQTGLSRRNCDRAFSDWSNYEVLVPSAPVYDVGTPDRPEVQMKIILDIVPFDSNGKPRCQSLVLWSGPQLDPAERALLRLFSEKHGW
jgi:hypothetical protein